MPEFLNWDEIETEIAETNRRISDSVDSEALRRKSREEFERGVRLGWFDKDGNPIPGAEDEDAEDEEEE